MQKQDSSLTDAPEFQELIKVLQTFRDEELQHKATAIEQDAQTAPMHALFTNVIQAGCRLAIKVAQVV
jgi:ubiquinone biosynthesis monooxygenase Coq7